MTDDAPLTQRQQQMMAYIDDELSAGERAEFERTLAQDPELALETVKFKNLMDLSQSLALAEPSELEVRRFWSRFYNRTEWRLGWVLLLVGAAVLAADGLYFVLTTDTLSWITKTATVSTVLGGVLLVWNTLRLKMRASHFDRYRGVMR